MLLYGIGPAGGRHTPCLRGSMDRPCPWREVRGLASSRLSRSIRQSFHRRNAAPLDRHRTQQHGFVDRGSLHRRPERPRHKRRLARSCLQPASLFLSVSTFPFTLICSALLLGIAFFAIADLLAHRPRLATAACVPAGTGRRHELRPARSASARRHGIVLPARRGHCCCFWRWPAAFYLSRYSMLLNDHRFMVGIDYVNQNIDLPLRWVSIAACVIAAFLVWTGRLRYRRCARCRAVAAVRHSWNRQWRLRRSQ